VTTLPRTDVVIAGGGWSGLLMAKELGARTPLSVVVLERGASRTAGDYAEDMDELDYAIRFRLMQDVSKETFTFRHTRKDRALPIRQFAGFFPGDGVGGAGEHWNGETPRFLPDVFEIYSRTVARYGAKRLPQNHSVQDWGVTYREIEPWYTKVEQLLGISGKGGINPYEGARSAEFPTPPLKPGYVPSLFTAASTGMGYGPYPMPSANLSQTYRNPDGVIRPACQYCGYCERFGCMIGAKAQPTNTLLPVIARQSQVTVKAGARVRRIIHKDGKAAGVTWVDVAGEEFFQPADLVIAASWTLNNTRLLLFSGAGRPYDPASGKGQVGRNLTHQATGAVTMFFDQPLNQFMGAGANSVAINDLDGDNFDHDRLTFLRGAQISAPAFGHRPIANFGALPPSYPSTWGAEWKKASIRFYDRTAHLAAAGEHLAYKTNYIDLDPVYRDRWGDPLARLTIDWNDNERNMMKFMSLEAAEIARAMGAREVEIPAPLGRYDVTSYKTSHVQGGTIMGVTPETSVLNPWLQHWEISNLFVLGASAFPQNASGNPTLTLLALTLRTADAIVARYLKSPGSLE
jgi:gluconate 2-dehydrogenase alpha chain